MPKPELAPGAMTEQLYISPYDGGWEFRVGNIATVRILGPKAPPEVCEEQIGQR